MVGDYSEEELAERQRQFKWERSEIDYMGSDSFVHIMRRLEESIYGHWQTVPEAPSPVLSVTNLTPSSAKLLGEVQPCVTEYPPTDEADTDRAPVARPPPPPSPPTPRATEEEQDDEDRTRSAKMPKDDKRQPTTASDKEDERTSTAEADEDGKDEDMQRPSASSGEEDKEERRTDATPTGDEQDEDGTKSSALPDDEKRQPAVTASEDAGTKPAEKQEEVDKTASGDNQPDEEKA